MDKLCSEPVAHFPHPFNDLVVDPSHGWVEQQYECPGVVDKHCTMETPHTAHPYDEAGQRYNCEGTEGEPVMLVPSMQPENDDGTLRVRYCVKGHAHDTLQFVDGNGDSPVSCGGWAD